MIRLALDAAAAALMTVSALAQSSSPPQDQQSQRGYQCDRSKGATS